MPSAAPPGNPAPRDGHLPDEALHAFRRSGPFGYYVHVPFCLRRCGYCDFNTYVPAADSSGDEAIGSYIESVIDEIHLSADVLSRSGVVRPLDTVFFGGGTPTMLPAADLVAVLDTLQDRFGFADDIEVTTEANPDSVTPEYIKELAQGGFTRLSVGMQSSVAHVLTTLDRTHVVSNVASAIRAGRDYGLATSVDLIYGTPGESLSDWAASVQSAIDLEPDHISAYALVIEPGTAMGAALARGALTAPDDDDEADKYEFADAMLSAAGYHWYEVSNWSRNTRGRCRHNEGYWSGGHWWGAGPGAHSNIGSVRWWNAKFPASYALRLSEYESPAQGREVLDAEQLYTEKIMLGVRLASGLPTHLLDSPFSAGAWVLPGLAADGLIDEAALVGAHEQGLGEPRVVLTQRGRLLADVVVRALLS